MSHASPLAVRNILPAPTPVVPSCIQKSAACPASPLTEYAVETRYPGPFEAVEQDEAERAIAETVFTWVSEQMSS